jgi:hypothetical protein
MKVHIDNKLYFFKKTLLKFKGVFCIIYFLHHAALSQEIKKDIIPLLKTKPQLDLRFNTRNSFISTRSARISGIKIGLSFEKKLKIGIGYNWLNSSITKNYHFESNIGEVNSYLEKLNLQYISPYIEYTYYHSKKLELTIPIHLGVGWTYFTYQNSPKNMSNLKPRSDLKLLLLYEPYSIAYYKPLPYLGIGFGLGYRLILISKSNYNLNSPTYVVKLKIYFEEVKKNIIQNN